MTNIRTIPKYRLHKATGRAVVTLPSTASGHRGREVFLGRYNSPESREKYISVLSEWKVTRGLAAATDDLAIVGDRRPRPGAGVGDDSSAAAYGDAAR